MIFKRNIFKRHTVCTCSALVIALLSVPSLAQDADTGANAQDFIQDFLNQTDGAVSGEAKSVDQIVEPLAAEEPVAVDVPEQDNGLNPPSIFDEPVVSPPIAEDDFPMQPTPVEVTDVPPPPDVEFAVPTVPAIPPVPEMPAASPLTPRVAVDDNLFFDSESLVPQPHGEMTRRGTVRRISPKAEPASKLVVVRKDYDPSSRRAKLVAADRAIKLGRYESALEMYNALFARDSNNQTILLGRAISLQKLGRDEAAIQAYEQLLEINPDNVEANVNMLGILGKRYPAVSQQRLTQLREYNPNNVAILAQLSIVEANVGRYREALKYLGIASGLEPQNAAHLYNMAVIADRGGEHKVAVQYYEQALETDAIHGGSRSVPREAIFTRLAQLR